MTDRPAVEAWLLCSEAVRIPPQCLAVTLRTSEPALNASYRPEFSGVSGADFRYVINYAQRINSSAAAAQDALGIITLDLEANRCAFSSCLQHLQSRCTVGGTAHARARDPMPSPHVCNICSPAALRAA